MEDDPLKKKTGLIKLMKLIHRSEETRVESREGVMYPSTSQH